MEDAVVLANCLYDIGTTSPEDIKAALQSFKDQRLPHVIEQYKASKATAKFLYGHVSSFNDLVVDSFPVSDLNLRLLTFSLDYRRSSKGVSDSRYST